MRSDRANKAVRERLAFGRPNAYGRKHLATGRERTWQASATGMLAREFRARGLS
ncbi:hypothetical protein MBRA_57900 (plasmid) [Mycobacterium branderi]|uniref:Uncharacterized protein n=1 Tax=Mycobacterium branderi TaxID=43348 RepID=A0ABN6BDS3_9MYCO|nr:hypothetical protein MBRA_57900 [Mycobacterium branderi]